MADEPRPIDPQARADLQALVDAVLPFAQDMLRRHDGFHPFGATMGLDGKIALTAADPGSEHPAPEAVIELLEAGYRKEAASGTLRAATICESVTVTEQTGHSTPAIKISIEHLRGESVAFYLPFSKRLLRGYQFGRMFGAPRTPSFLASTPASDAT